jgi:hypothetical protein
MMAHDTGPTLPNAVTEEHLQAVRRAIARYSDGADSAELRRALKALAREARERSVAPEQLLVLLKSIWYELPAVRSAPADAERTRVLQQLVTMCIKEYYSLG